MQTIYLDISNKGVIPCIMAKQSEVGRKFLAVITDNGVPYNIPDDSLLSIWYEGDTDAGNYSSIEEKSAFSIDGNKVTVELVAQMLLKPGNGELCLSITHGDGGETNTWNILYEVEYKPGAGSSVPTEYYTALTEAGAFAAKNAQIAKENAEIAKKYGTEMLLMAYPIGSIYLSVNNTSPNVLFGGTWERIEDRFLLAASDTYAAGDIGGEETVTLTTEQMPKHRHVERVGFDGTDSDKYTLGISGTPLSFNGNGAGRLGIDRNCTTADAGGGQPHNNMPPYLSVYMWKRTA